MVQVPQTLSPQIVPTVHELWWYIHERSCKFMNSSCSVHQIFYLRFMNKCSWSVLECSSWTVHEQLMNGQSVHELFVLNRIVHECSWMFMNVHLNISWTDYSWKIHRIYLMNISWNFDEFVLIHERSWFRLVNYHELFMNSFSGL